MEVDAAHQTKEVQKVACFTHGCVRYLADANCRNSSKYASATNVDWPTIAAGNHNITSCRHVHIHAGNAAWVL